MPKHKSSPLNSFSGEQGKVTKTATQLQTIFTYLGQNIETASMVSDATAIPQKNICRYKRDLEKAGLLWELYKKPCKRTGFKAWYLTTNKALMPTDSQLKLFLDGGQGDEEI